MLKNIPRGQLLFIIVLVISVLILLAYTIVWQMGARAMKGAVFGWITDQREAGLNITHGDVKTGGFPFFLRTLIDTACIGDEKNGHWCAEQLAIDALPYDLNRLIFSPSGSQTLNLKNFPDGYQNWSGRADRIRASLGRDKEREWFFALNIKDGSLMGDNVQASLASNNLIINLGPDQNRPQDIRLQIQIEGLSGEVALDNDPFRNLALDRIEISLAGEAIDQFGSVGAHPLRDWSRQGGSVAIDRVLITRGESQFAAKGDVKVDGDGYPQGEIEILFVKPFPLLEQIEATKVLTEAEAASVRGAVAVATMAQGGKIDGSFVMQDGVLRYDGQLLTKLPVID